MKIGCPTDPRKDVIEEIEWIGNHGFDFVDLCLEPDRAAVENIDPARVREALEERGLEALGHLAHYLPIGSAMASLRRAAVTTAGEYLGAFAAIGVPAVTIHSNWPSGMFSAEEGIAWQVESLSEVLGFARQAGLGLMYEPIPTEKDSPEHITKVLDLLPDLLCHLDIGHCNLCGRDPATMVRQFGPRLHHVHLHDNDGRGDLHLPPGTGTIEWPPVFRALRDVGYDKTLTVEVFSPERDYVLLAKRKVMEWLESTAA